MTVLGPSSIGTASLRSVLEEAAAVAARLYGEAGAVEAKPDGSPVTEADRRVNEVLRLRLSELRPEAAWLSEESADGRERLACEWLWVVDPLDGTKEFVGGIPEFAISVGLVRDGDPVAGGVVNPATGEGGVAAGGELEVWNLRAKEPAASVSVAQASVSRTEVEDGSAAPLLGLTGSTVPRGSVAYKLLRVAAGSDDLTFSVQGKSEWDVCGGAALLAAAGKVYRRFDGRPLAFNGADTRIRCGTVAASAALAREFLARLPEVYGETGAVA